jgi:hypothetical protein
MPKGMQHSGRGLHAQKFKALQEWSLWTPVFFHHDEVPFHSF